MTVSGRAWDSFIHALTHAQSPH
ncbi:hypothetical protein ACGF3G_03430 [Streptomyces sp. NPDC048179]